LVVKGNSRQQTADMGQYYHAIILDAAGKILVWMNAFAYGSGVKLTEHSYVGNNFVSTFEFSLSPEGIYHKSRVVWAGDYADKETGQDKNLYEQCDDYNLIRPQVKSTEKYRFVVNHTKKQYADKSKWEMHPLPLLTAEGNGRGGGDIQDAPPCVGSWARDVISVEESLPEHFQEVVFE
jgi:hypothetical protein